MLEPGLYTRGAGVPLVRAVHFDLAADLGCYRLKVVLHGMVDNVDPVLDVCCLVGGAGPGMRLAGHSEVLHELATDLLLGVSTCASSVRLCTTVPPTFGSRSSSGCHA